MCVVECARVCCVCSVHVCARVCVCVCVCVFESAWMDVFVFVCHLGVGGSVMCFFELKTVALVCVCSLHIRHPGAGVCSHHPGAGFFCERCLPTLLPHCCLFPYRHTVCTHGHTCGVEVLACVRTRRSSSLWLLLLPAKCPFTHPA